jgi:hypothetical protein
MATTYHYANLTKREWFSTDALGGSAKFKGLGLNLTARAFDLLLVCIPGETVPEAPVSIGRWVGDSIAIVGDSDDNWLNYFAEFADLSADVILLIVSRDGFERVGDAAAEDDSLFVQLCHLVVTRQSLVLEPHMRKRFGFGFYQRYKDLCQGTSFNPRDLARPKSIGTS